MLSRCLPTHPAATSARMAGYATEHQLAAPWLWRRGAKLRHYLVIGPQPPRLVPVRGNLVYGAQCGQPHGHRRRHRPNCEAERLGQSGCLDSLQVVAGVALECFPRQWKQIVPSRDGSGAAAFESRLVAHLFRTFVSVVVLPLAVGL